MWLFVLRLLCSQEDRTVSLLPNFCLPRRQYGIPTLAALITHVVLGGEGLHRGARHLHPICPPGPSSVRCLVNGLRRRRLVLSAYVCSVSPRLRDPCRRLTGWRQELEPIVDGLIHGFVIPKLALLHHAVLFHGRYQLGLA